MSKLRDYLLAVLTSAASVALTRFTWPVFARTPFAPAFAAVAAATHWGSGPVGLAALGLTTIGAVLFFPKSGPYAWDNPSLIVFVLIGFVGNRLIAGRNRAVVALRATLQHIQDSEARLRQSQKMEAIGQLVAGVAHNFNNLLTVTMGYVDVLEEETEPDSLDRHAVHEIRRATERGAALTRQLLAFSRKQDARLTRVDLVATVHELRAMLESVIPEDIALDTQLGPGPQTVLIDPIDFEQVVLNLVINARDALRSGGTITIQVDREHVGRARVGVEMTPGDFICLRIRDDGVGMSADVQAHLFEPFFTTKEVGEGTGLGLPFVHGIARNSGGFVTVDSTLGKGTTVAAYFSATD